MLKKTIFALSTGQGKAGIAIIRVTGSRAFEVVKELTGSVPVPRKATLYWLKFKEEYIDQALVVCFKSNASYTGEDIAEFHIHGSVAVITSLSEALSNGLKLTIANPGEFTRRALENGCMDLSQVEGLLDLIDSETKEQKNQSLKILSGILGDRTVKWRSSILSSLALAEVMIDFSDEEVPDSTVSDIFSIVCSLVDELNSELEESKSVESIRGGFDITIIGKPNVGKSSLLNYLAGNEKAIVSEQAGTTRDIIELSIDLKGFRVNFFDTAGIQVSSDQIEKIGMDRAKKKAELSNMRIFLLNSSDIAEGFGVTVEDSDMILCAKSDIQSHENYSGISSKTGEGVAKMLENISKKVFKSTHYSGVLINKRHRQVIKSTVSCLQLVSQELKHSDVRIEIVAEHLRLAIIELDFLVGKINVEDVLGDIFSSFCIGK